jgi:hypothetical protein
MIKTYQQDRPLSAEIDVQKHLCPDLLFADLRAEGFEDILMEVQQHKWSRLKADILSLTLSTMLTSGEESPSV